MDGKRKAFEKMMVRNMGMSDQAREKIAKQNAQFNDWYGVCRKCGKAMSGTIAELRKGCSCGSES